MNRWWVRWFQYGRPYKGRLAVVLLLVLVGVGLEALLPWPLKFIVDNVLKGDRLPDAMSWLPQLPGASSDPGLLLWLAGASVMLFVAKRAAHMMRGYVVSGVGGLMMFDLGSDLFERLQRLSLRFHGRQRTGDLVRRITKDTESVRKLVVSISLTLLTSLATLAVMFVIMWQLDAFLAVVALVAAPPLLLVIKMFSEVMRGRYYEQNQAESELVATAEQTLTALPAVKAFTRETYEVERFRAQTQRTVRSSLRALASGMQFSISKGAVTAMGTVAIMIVGGIHVLNGTLSVGSLLVFLSYLTSLYAPMESLAGLSDSVASASAGARRVLEVLDEEDEVREAPTAYALPAPSRGHIHLESVTFGYRPGEPVLSDVSLEIEPGETVALVGRTGAGKSTLISLLFRFFDPWHGIVSVDGHDVRGLQLESLRSQISLVLQEPFLLPLSVAENITYGRPGATRAEIEAAAEAANAAEFIADLPEGYETVLGERGATLSGGQRQRVAIARALLKDAPIVVLDEPTSALDATTEASLMEALDRLMERRTVIVIAHRLTTVQRADRILLLTGGRIQRSWTHEEIAGADGLYHGLHELKFELAAWEMDVVQ